MARHVEPHNYAAALWRAYGVCLLCEILHRTARLGRGTLRSAGRVRALPPTESLPCKEPASVSPPPVVRRGFPLVLQQDPLRGAAGGAAEVVHQEAPLAILFDLLDAAAVGLRERLLHPTREVRVGAMRVLVDGEDALGVDDYGQLSLAEG